jgi:sirohydrochlorin cobaltochelatase
MTRGLLLFAHGARDPRWAEPFEAVASEARRRGAALGSAPQVVLGFLEFMQPDLLGAGESLAAGGCSQVDVVPLFLGAGGHVRKDLPALMDQLRARHPEVQWTLRPAIGESARVVEAMATVSLDWLLPESGADGLATPPTPP